MKLLKGYRPHRAQLEFHSARARFRAYVGGVGAGKTFAGAAEALRWAVRWPGSTGVVVAPTYTMLKDIIVPVLKRMTEGAEVSWNMSDLTLRIGESTVLLRSAQRPERLQGLTLSWFWIDEAAIVPEYVWTVLVGRLREREGAKGWITTTPKGRNWVWREFVERASEERVLVRARTWENPYLPRDYVEDLRASYEGEVARQELEGEFVAYEGLVYSEFDREKHLRPAPSGSPKRVVAGLDWGYTNPSALVVLGQFGDELWVLAEWRGRRLTQEEVAERVAEEAKRWGVEAVFVDPSAPSLVELLRRTGVRAYPANNELLRGIHRVKSLLAGGRLFVAEGAAPWLVAELETYSWRRRKDGGWDEVPEKGADHSLDALRYAVMGLGRGEGWKRLAKKLQGNP